MNQPVSLDLQWLYYCILKSPSGWKVVDIFKLGRGYEIKLSTDACPPQVTHVYLRETNGIK